MGAFQKVTPPALLKTWMLDAVTLLAAALLCASVFQVVSAHAQYSVSLIKDINQTQGAGGAYPICEIGDRLILSGQGVGVASADRDLRTTRVLHPEVSSISRCEPLGNSMLLQGKVGDEDRLILTDGNEAGTVILNVLPAGLENISLIASTGNIAFLFAKSPESGREIWRTDGTAVGTYIVKDIVPGTAGNSAADFVTLNGLLFFSALTADRGKEVWRSDGTTEGTFPLEVAPGNFSGLQTRLIQARGALWFMGQEHATAPIELFRTDGTTLGTQPVSGIVPVASRPLALLSAVGDEIIFSAEDRSQVAQVILTDGTAGNSRIVLSYQRAGTSTIQSAARIGARTYFTVNSAEFGQELYVTEGSEASTRLVVDLIPGPDSSLVHNLMGFGSEIIFNAKKIVDGSTELFRSDGTAEGTVAFASLLGEEFSGPVTGGLLLSDRLLFSMYSEVQQEKQAFQYFPSGGIPTPITIGLKGRNAGSKPSVIGEVSAKMVLRATDGVNGAELFSSDGSEEGTRIIRDLAPGFRSSQGSLRNLTAKLGSKILLFADDWQHGAELWVTDGSADGTLLLNDTNPGLEDSRFYSVLELSNIALFLERRDDADWRVWVSDGTISGTRIISSLAAALTREQASFLGQLPGNRALLRVEKDSEPHALWISDGTEAGTLAVPYEFATGSSIRAIAGKPIADGLLFVIVRNNTSEIWFTNGSSSGTRIVATIPAPFEVHSFLEIVGDAVFFAGYSTQSGRELWKLTFSTGAVEPLSELSPGTGWGFDRSLGVCRNKMVFWGTRPDTGAELFGFDLQTLQYELLADLEPGSKGSSVGLMFPLDGSYVFMGRNSTAGIEPWITDCTPVGTRLLGDLVPGQEGSSFRPQLARPDGLVFSASLPSSGEELFVLRSTTKAGDSCPLDPFKDSPGSCGCGVPDTDVNNNGVADCIEVDNCPADPLKLDPGQCGCGISDDSDADQDGSADCVDQCLADPRKAQPGVCGCGLLDEDLDQNGIIDCLQSDQCPTDPLKESPGVCGCGILEEDLDGNGTIDCPDTILSFYTPQTPTIKRMKMKRGKRGQRFLIGMEQYQDVKYEISFRIEIPRGKGKKKKIRTVQFSRVSNGAKYILRRRKPLPARSVIRVSYRYRLELPGRLTVSRQSAEGALVVKSKRR